MRILALESSTDWCSVAVGEEGHWLVREEQTGSAHAERVLALVASVLAEAGWALRAVDGIGFGAGPGSFTGIRVACGVAQGLALGAQLPLVPVATLEALAQAAWTAQGASRVLACLDARMREIYLAAYTRSDSRWLALDPPRVLPPAEAAAPAGVGWFGAGGGFAAYPALVQQLGLARHEAALRPTALAVAQLALPRLHAGEGVEPGEALPLYVRHRVALTTAERAAGERM